MNPGQRGVQTLARGKAHFSGEIVCTSCLFRRAAHPPRRHASAATAAVEQSQDPSVPPVSNTGPQKAYRLLASPVLSRPPILTRDLTPFEKAFHLYQRRLNERLALPFTRFFYYKRGTPGEADWKRKVRIRKAAAGDIGVYSGYGKEAWNDELLVGDRTSEPAHQVEALIRDAEGKDPQRALPAGDENAGAEVGIADPNKGQVVVKNMRQRAVVTRPVSRLTTADQQNDTRSLNRKLDRSLYLLIRDKDDRWRFPEDRVYGRENLQQAAERIILQSFGMNMNTWVVGHHPVGHYAYPFPKPIFASIAPNHLVSSSTENSEQEEMGEKVFFMKVRIMTGQADLSKNEYGAREFRWLVKEEIEELVTGAYWSSVRNMLVER